MNNTPFLSGDVARMINASIEPPRNGGSSFYFFKNKDDQQIENRFNEEKIICLPD